MKDTFDGIPIPVFFISESEPVTVACVVQCRHTIDEKHGVIDVVVLTNLHEKGMSENLNSYRFKGCTERSFVSGFDSGASQYCSSSNRITVPQPQRDPDSDHRLTVDRFCEPSYG